MYHQRQREIFLIFLVEQRIEERCSTRTNFLVKVFLSAKNGTYIERNKG